MTKAIPIKNETEFVRVCTGCETQVTKVGEDKLDYCTECEMLVEGLGYSKEIERTIE